MKIMIAGASWMLHWSDIAWKRARKRDESVDHSAGITFCDTREICISSHPSSLQVRQGILVHELLHACLAMTGFTNAYWKKLGSGLEEHLCERIENPLASVFRYNPNIVKLLTMEEPKDWPKDLHGLE